VSEPTTLPRAPTTIIIIIIIIITITSVGRGNSSEDLTRESWAYAGDNIKMDFRKKGSGSRG
jgi:hypothetical protein